VLYRSLSSEQLRLGVYSRELVSRKIQEKMAKLVDLLYDWYWDTRTHTYIREGNKYKQPNEWKNKKEKRVLQQRVEGNQKINQRDDLVVNRAEPSGDMRRLCRLFSGRVSSTEQLKKRKWYRCVVVTASTHKGQHAPLRYAYIDES